MRRAPLLVLAATLVNLACDPDDCEQRPASFQLDLEFEDKGPPSPAVMIRVDVAYGTERRRRFFEVGEALQDNFTSLGVELDPAPTVETQVDVTVAAYPSTSTTTRVLGEVSQTLEVDPNGCNRFRLELEI
ncbi:MAG: hypothetical protein KC933_04930 [Myxococcales bacterium]|nr:hypothetical protein [Myxococcales bacterium]MCB9649823.1 hypothetical protein [Deltaproteobacteria bacterium]